MKRVLFVLLLTAVALPATAQEVDGERDVSESTAEWVSSIREEAGELFVTGFAPEGTRVVIVVGTDGYGGETRADADGTWSLTAPLRGDATIAIVRSDTGERQVVRASTATTAPDMTGAAEVERIEFAVQSTEPPLPGDVVRGTASPGAKVRVSDADAEIVTTTTTDELGRWQFLMPEIDTTHIFVSSAAQPDDIVRIDLPIDRAPLTLDAPDIVIQPQSIPIVTEPGKRVSVRLNGAEIGTATADRDGYVMVKMEDREPGRYELEVVVDEGSVREVRTSRDVRVLNRRRMSAFPQIAAYAAGGAAGAVVGGLIGFSADRFSFQPSYDVGPPLSQVGIAFGSALGGPIAVHWVSRRADYYQNLVAGLGGSLAVVGSYYALLGFLRGPVGWQASMFTSGLLAPLASMIAYNLSPAPRRALRKQQQATWTAGATPNSVFVGARW